MHRSAVPVRPHHLAGAGRHLAGRPLGIGLLVAVLIATLAVPAAAIEPAPSDYPQDPTVDITEQVVDLTFPVAAPDDSVSFTDTFLALRGGGSRLHAATDLMAPKHRAVHAAAGGVLSWVPYEPGKSGYSALGEPSYGWMVSLKGDDGRRYSYVHLNNDTPERDGDGHWLDDDNGGIEHALSPKIVDALEAKGSSLNSGDGVRVERGELLGWLGDSGNAKYVASHLHFEIHMYDPEVGEYRINPYHSLVEALSRGDVPGSVTPEGDAAGDVDDSTGGGAGGFSDLDPDGTHTDAILRLIDDGIVRECDEGLYCPFTAVTRDDIAYAFAVALDLDTAAALSARGGSGYDDVPDDHPYAGEIAAVSEFGVLGGYGDGTFGPDDPLSRQQLATVLVQGFSVPAAAELAPFDDVDEDDVHGSTIAAAYEAGLTKGCGDGSSFCRLDDVSRAQIATFLDNALAWKG